jgi:phage RecT family recombinase
MATSASVQTAPSAAQQEATASELLERVLAQPIRTAGNLWKTMQALLPAHMTQERFAALVISAAARDSNVFDCTGESILTAIYQAAALGLEINAATGEAYLIPYKSQATLVPGYKGLVKLAIRSREVRAIEARLVYQGEEATFGVYYGTDSRIEHRPNFDVDRAPGTVIYAYAVAKLPDGSATFDVMTRKQMDAIRARSAAGRNPKSPWTTDTEEMYRKTVTRRLCKYLPMSPELSEAVELSDRHETGEYERKDVRGHSEGSDELNAAIKAKAAPTPTSGAERIPAKPASVVHPCEACSAPPGEPHKDACPYAD